MNEPLLSTEIKLDGLPRGSKIIDSVRVNSFFVKNDTLYAVEHDGDSCWAVIYSSYGPKRRLFNISKYEVFNCCNSNVAFEKLVDNENNIWIACGKSLILYTKGGKVKALNSLPAGAILFTIAQGRGNDILMFAPSAAYRTPDFGKSWEKLESSFPEINPPPKIVKHRNSIDTVKFDLIEAGVQSVLLDKQDRLWAGSNFGLLYCDDDYKTWHTYDMTSLIDTTKSHPSAHILAMNSEGDFLFLAPMVLALKKHDEAGLQLVRRHEFKKPTNEDIHKSWRYYFSDSSIVSDFAEIQWLHDRPLLASKWIKSDVTFSNDFGKTWKKIIFGRDIEIGDIALTSSFIYISTSRGMARIAKKYYR